jgi:TrmH family RNA methyltransferase
MGELTNKIRKMVVSLADVKGRRRENLFVAEGTKCVCDTIDAFRCRYLFATDDWLAQHDDIAARCGEAVTTVTKGDLREMTTLTATPPVIAVYDLPEPAQLDINSLNKTLTLALDRVQDPGNLGTIIRTCDWFGITTILASKDTVDLYNPKTVQSTMGAISRIKVIYCDLADVLSKANVPVYGTFLDGRNLYDAPLADCGIIVMGNEGSGIGEQVAATVTERLLIPSFPPDRPTSESLNVATATAITLAEFRRRTLAR